MVDTEDKAETRARRQDGWKSTITGLGQSRDKRTGTQISPALVQGSREEFDSWYASDHTAQKIARLPAREMTREWITLQVDDSVEGEEVKTEASTGDKLITAKQVSQALDDLSVQARLTDAITWARVHGGALIYMSVDDGSDRTEPLNLDNIKKLKFLKVYDRWECEINKVVTGDLDDEENGEPDEYQIRPEPQHATDVTDGWPVHASRVIRIDGVRTSHRRMQYNGGWADSIYTAMRTTLEDYGISWSAVTHLLQDFSQAVMKMKGLADAIMQSEGNLVLDRMVAMDLCRSVARAIPIDAEDEDFFRAQTPMGGLPETIDRLMLRVAEAAEMPATLLFGQSPAGLNATGESDIRFFYDQIRAKQEETVRPALDRILEILFASKDGPTKGKEPENWSYGFDPLWQETDKQKAETRKTQAEADAVYLADGVLDPEEVAMSRFGGDAYSTDTVLDMEKRAEAAKMEEMEPEPEPQPLIPQVPQVPQVPQAPPTEEPENG